ncbi:hypothetical protein W97_06011 [Coniosporium apollinis CBS 100218]|uniref:F-box domain-containing protein n=1 Tax=Coniosporium apollinis (strain CBS 100218) TaxID=1168221 RepID=R7YY33_CONA1|nr:uncharacterized protein W97_06011 [Coniosporium apollinis CBS 100218]EON66763.1 hypothetical protein W97_06011 [Coniosporium apollinis CBS 100218]
MPSAGDRVFDIAELRCLILSHLSCTTEDLRSLLRLGAVSHTLRNHVLSDSRCRRLLYLDAVACDSAALIMFKEQFKISAWSFCSHCDDSDRQQCWIYRRRQRSSAVPPQVFTTSVAVNPLLHDHFPKLFISWWEHRMTVALPRSTSLSTLFTEAQLRKGSSCREMLIMQPPLTRLYIEGWNRVAWSIANKEGVRVGQFLDTLVMMEEKNMKAKAAAKAVESAIGGCGDD